MPSQPVNARIACLVCEGCEYFSLVQGSDEARKEVTKQALYTALEAGLRLLHPFMPFVTEELWQRLPRRPAAASESAPDAAADSAPPVSIMTARYPEGAAAGRADAGAESAMENVAAVVREARALRVANGLKPKDAAAVSLACTVRAFCAGRLPISAIRRVHVTVSLLHRLHCWPCRNARHAVSGCICRVGCIRTVELDACCSETSDLPVQLTAGLGVQDDASRDILSARADDIATLVGACPSCAALPAGAPAPAGCAVAVVDASTTLYLHLAGLLDPEMELAKLRKQLGEAEKRLEAVRGRIGMPAYAANTPEDVRARDDAKVAELVSELERLGAAMTEMQSLAEQNGAAAQRGAGGEA
jgi:valyl-tRNA synthetase